ncbi:MAG: hypothetical protein V2G41_09465 [bacterium JZ-2024 1]
MTLPLEVFESLHDRVTSIPSLREVIGVEVTICRPGMRRKVSVDVLEVDADKDLLHLTKEIVRSPEYERIVRKDNEIRRLIRRYTLPSFISRGVYIVPLSLIYPLDNALNDMRLERENLVELFLRAYPSYISEARLRLRSLFNESDYPPVEALREAFDVKVRYICFDTPLVLQEVNSELFRREAERARQEWDRALEEMKKLLRVTMAELVDHMVERLTPGPDGRPKIFRDSLVENMLEFLDLFEVKNLANDRELAAVVSRARDLLQGVTPESLRRSQHLREATRSGLEQIKGAVDSLIAPAPRRRLFL